jgi:hypothetical protein
LTIPCQPGKKNWEFVAASRTEESVNDLASKLCFGAISKNEKSANGPIVHDDFMKNLPPARKVLRISRPELVAANDAAPRPLNMRATERRRNAGIHHRVAVRSTVKGRFDFAALARRSQLLCS